MFEVDKSNYVMLVVGAIVSTLVGVAVIFYDGSIWQNAILTIYVALLSIQVGELLAQRVRRKL